MAAGRSMQNHKYLWWRTDYNYFHKKVELYKCLTSVRSSHLRCFIIKGVLRNFAKFTGKHLRNTGKRLRPATLLKKRCFPVNFAKFLRAPFLQNTSGRLLLSILDLSQVPQSTSNIIICRARNAIKRQFLK